MIKDPRVIALRKRFGFTEDGAANTIATLDAVDPLRVRGRAYVEWQRLDTYQHTDIKEHRTILIFIKDGGAFSISSVNPLSALRRMNAIAWAEQIQRPVWAETTPHADEPGRHASPDPVRAHAVCLSRMVEMLLNEVDRDTLARMRRAAYPESGE